MNKGPLLEMRSIRKTFPGVVALDDIDLDLNSGEVHVLLGENGAGKSTLVKVLSGAYQKTSGRIVLNGTETIIRNPRNAQELGIGIIYQELNLVPQLSAAENIFLGREHTLRFGLLDRAMMVRDSQKLLMELGVDVDVRCPVRELGIAQQQMVEVVKALSLEARILIMDEPTSALSEHEISELFITIRRLKEKGVAIIYISHRLEELFEIGDRVTVLRDGRTIGTKLISNVQKSDLIAMMVNRELKSHFPKEKAKRGREILRVQGLTRKGVLHGISFSLHQGEILGIAGLLGSGRTELARALFGVDTIDTGTVYVNGVRQRITSPRRAIDLGMGLLTEDRKSQGLVMTLPVRDNICLASIERFSRYGFIDIGRERRAATRYSQSLRIKTPSLDQQVLYLSGGNQQKVVLSKWLCREAEILIFDEPTRGIDVGAKVEIYKLMNRLVAEGAGILMISSELLEILGMSDRILVMNQGRISGEFDAAEATQEKILQCALGVRYEA